MSIGERQNQGKYSGICFIYSIKHHHRNDGKMPGTRSVRGRHNYGKRAADKHDQCRKDTQMCRKGKAIECKIEMEKVTSPNSQCIKNKEGNIAHAF